MLEYADETTGGTISAQEILNITGQHVAATISHYDRRKMKRRFQIADAIAKMKPQVQILGPTRGIPSATVTSASVTSATVESANGQSMMENESKQ